MNDGLDDNKNNETTITWNHLLNAIKQQLYPNVSKSMKEIIDNKENEIKNDDLSEDTINKVLNILTDKKKSMSQEEYLYLQQLLKQGANFRPFTQGKLKPIPFSKQVSFTQHTSYLVTQHHTNQSQDNHSQNHKYRIDDLHIDMILINVDYYIV